MKKFILTILLVSSIAFSQETKYYNDFEDLKSNEDYYLFGNNVKLRTNPNVESEIIETLKIGEKIKILEKTIFTKEYNGINSPFYKVKYLDKTGYILGGLIALEKKSTSNTIYLFGLKKSDKKLYIQIRYKIENKEYLQTDAELFTNEFSIEILDNKGLINVNSILYINYLSEACGVNGGGIYFFQNTNKLIKAFDITKVSDAGAYWFQENLIFPSESGGHKNKIIYTKEVGESVDESSNWTKSEKTSREFEFDGKKITPELIN